MTSNRASLQPPTRTLRCSSRWNRISRSPISISKQILGEVGEKALETSEEALETSSHPWYNNSEELREAVIKTVCLDAFLSVVRHLDLVLTPTGFGVVANNEVSPASSSRVEALIEQCRVAFISSQQTVLALLCNVPGWGKPYRQSRAYRR